MALPDVILSNGLRLADISEAIGTVSWDFGVGKVSQFSFPAVDIGGKLRRNDLLRAGRTLEFDGTRWEIAAVERDYRGADVWLQFEARSRLARRLRLMTGPDKVTDTTPAQWITSKVKKAGGVAVVETGAKRRTINQKRTESVLDVLAALASDTGVEWTEYGGVFYVGTPWWAFKGGCDLPTWTVSARGKPNILGLEAASFVARESLDDRGNAAEATLTVAPEQGVKVRPWHLVDVSGADDPDNGPWLVTASTFDDSKASDVSLSLSRPLKSSPKKGSTGAGASTPGAAGGDIEVPADGWVPGADKVWAGCTRTPREIVAHARTFVGQNLWAGYCQTFVSHLARNPYSGGPDLAKQSWYNMKSRLPNTPHGSSRTPPAGAWVVWSGPNAAGHIAVSIGGGRMITTTGGAITEMGVGDYIGWSYYLGWMCPVHLK